MKQRAMITGIRGQDGSYMAELLLRAGYEVHGVTRDAARGFGHSEHIRKAIVVHQIEQGADSWRLLLRGLRPAELYHFAADSFVPNGWEQPVANLEANAELTIKLLEAIRRESPRTRMLNACSREVFGHAVSGPANEDTKMRPDTPYGISKAASRWFVECYRQRFDLFVCNAILFNHESPRRGNQFVSSKITQGVADVHLGLIEHVELGNLEARRDWGHAKDYVEAMWRMLQIASPEDFVIGTGVSHSIADFAQHAFKCVQRDWTSHVRSVQRFSRQNDSSFIVADISKAHTLLNWRPSISFMELVESMTTAALEQRTGRRRSRDAA